MKIKAQMKMPGDSP